MEKKNNLLKSDVEIGKRVKEYRMIRNLTQRNLADLVMISPSSITRLEKGQIMVSVYTIIEISKVLEVSISYLLIGEIGEDRYERTDLENIHNKLKKCSVDKRKKIVQLFNQIVDTFFLI